MSTIDELFPVPGPPLAGRLGAEACRNAFCRELARDAAAKGNRRNMPVAVSVMTSVQVEIREEKMRRRLRRLGKDEECLILRLYVGEIPRCCYAAAPNESSASLRSLVLAVGLLGGDGWLCHLDGLHRFERVTFIGGLAVARQPAFCSRTIDKMPQPLAPLLVLPSPCA